METAGSSSLQLDPAGADEARVVASIKAGDDAAFADVVRQFGGRMLAVARRFLHQEQDAQDAVQDAFLSAFKSIDQFQGQARLGTWLHRIVVNAALMKLRSQRRRPERAIEDLLPKFQDDGHRADVGAAWAVTFDTAVADHELRDVVRRSIDQLPESHRTILLLRDIEQRSTEETAELLGINPGAVKTRLHRARQALRTLLDPYMRGATV
jgi:RNA polymerase sigma-70 factor (ECF subfamily)